MLGWFAYVSEQERHRAPVVVGDYVMEMGRDTFENWQSEFLQLLSQVGGLRCSSMSGPRNPREGDDRKEAKLDAILRKLDPDGGDAAIMSLDQKYQPQ